MMLKTLFSKGEETEPHSVLVLGSADSLLQQHVGTLHQAGYQVMAPTNGDAAVALLDQALLPDVLILDLEMPDLDVAEFLKMLRLRFGRIDLPPVLLIAGDEAGEVTANELQVEDYLQIPFESQDLLTHVEHLLEKSEPSKG